MVWVSGLVRGRAHPRSRGENIATDVFGGIVSGSSPLTWGKRVGGVERGGNMGLIPAHVGKTSPRHTQTRSPPAHPRSRGENARAASARGLRPGSSPLTWGKPAAKDSTVFERGLIPAHVGKTYASKACRLPLRAHPRSRGENMGETWWRKLTGGSSPLTWGKRCQERLAFIPVGLIPAHVGKTV